MRAKRQTLLLLCPLVKVALAKLELQEATSAWFGLFCVFVSNCRMLNSAQKLRYGPTSNSLYWFIIIVSLLANFSLDRRGKKKKKKKKRGTKTYLSRSLLELDDAFSGLSKSAILSNKASQGRRPFPSFSQTRNKHSMCLLQCWTETLLKSLCFHWDVCFVGKPSLGLGLSRAGQSRV